MDSNVNRNNPGELDTNCAFTVISRILYASYDELKYELSWIDAEKGSQMMLSPENLKYHLIRAGEKYNYSYGWHIVSAPKLTGSRAECSKRLQEWGVRRVGLLHLTYNANTNSYGPDGHAVTCELDHFDKEYFWDAQGGYKLNEDPKAPFLVFGLIKNP